MPDQAYWFAKVKPGQEQEQIDPATGQTKGLYQIERQTIVPLKYYGNGQEVGFQVLMGLDTTRFQNWVITVNVRDELGGGSARFSLAEKGFSFQADSRGFQGSLGVERLLERLEGEINRNLLQLTVQFEARRENGSAIKGTAQTQEPLHLMLQKAVVVLPGLLGSSLWLKGERYWPVEGQDQDLGAMANNNRGQPVNPASAIEMNLGEGLDEPEGWQKWLQADLPDLRCKVGSKTEKVAYYRLQGYPYDWRLPLETVIEQLLGDEAGIEDSKAQRAIFQAAPRFEGAGRLAARPPSLRTVLAYLKQANPFLADKAALVGQGTGGLIVNGAIRRAGVEAMVDRAFFVGTPFYGALSAYSAFLSGSLRLGEGAGFSLEGEPFEQLAGNLPGLYYLAPSARFPYPVARLVEEEGGSLVLERSKSGINEVMAEIRRLAGLEDDPLVRTARLWNTALAEAADKAYESWLDEPIQIELERYLAFYGVSGPKSTVGQIRYDGRSGFGGEVGQRLGQYLTIGDGIVPVESGRGEIATEALYEVEGEHQKLLASQTIWNEIGQRLVSWLAVADPPPPPQPWVEDEPGAEEPVPEPVADRSITVLAETLRQAALSGVPFCEGFEAVLKIPAEELGPESVANAAIAALAEALSQATPEGVPFCEGFEEVISQLSYSTLGEEMLSIRREQLEILGEVLEEAFQRQLLKNLRKDRPELCADRSDEAILGIINWAGEKAKSYGLFLPEDVTRFVHFVLRYGQDYETKSDTLWAVEILNDVELDIFEKFEQIETHLQVS